MINLDQLDSRHALPDERSSVEALGLTYRQIPVVWEHPTHENLAEFREAMAKYADRRAFVHCVANIRVSVFMALYRVLDLGWDRENAMQSVRSLWKPNDTWQQFIETELFHVNAVASRFAADGSAVGALGIERALDTGPVSIRPHRSGQRVPSPGGLVQQ